MEIGTKSKRQLLEKLCSGSSYHDYILIEFAKDHYLLTSYNELNPNMFYLYGSNHYKLPLTKRDMTLRSSYDFGWRMKKLYDENRDQYNFILRFPNSEMFARYGYSHYYFPRHYIYEQIEPLIDNNQLVSCKTDMQRLGNVTDAYEKLKELLCYYDKHKVLPVSHQVSEILLPHPDEMVPLSTFARETLVASRDVQIFFMEQNKKNKERKENRKHKKHKIKPVHDMEDDFTDYEEDRNVKGVKTQIFW